MGGALTLVGSVWLGARRAFAEEGAFARDLESLIPKLMKETAVPGLSIALVKGGKLWWTRGFGVKNSTTMEPVDDATVFEAASVSKTVFAYVVLKLCERGVLGLDTPLTKYLPEKFLEGDARLDRVTARHVLSHTGGFQDWRGGDHPLKIHFAPGEKFMYSGEGYFYLQSVVTQLMGQVDASDCAQFEAGLKVCATDFDAFMRRNLLEPFGMTESGYEWREGWNKAFAKAHDVKGKVIERGKGTRPAVARYGAAGGLNTTAKDYAKFLIEIVAPKEIDAFRLTQASLKEMVRPQVKLPEDQKIDGASAWALGWAVQERPVGNFIVHSGGQSGYRSLAMASVDKKTGFVVLTNGDNGARVIYDPRVLELLGAFVAGKK